VFSIQRFNVTWVSLDAGDDDPMRFWTYMLTALDSASPVWAPRGLNLLRAPYVPPLERVLMTLINSMAASDARLALILDDYHMVSAPIIHTGLAFLRCFQP
jgi:LuxR family maltose regulon positive regulatory protein